MAITRTIERTVSLDAMAWRESLPGLAYQGEQNAHQFVIHCTQDGAAVTLTGSVLLKFLRPDGIAVDVPGSVVDGAAVVALSGNCYEVMGRAEITIFVTQDSATVAVYSANTAVTRTTSGEEISGGDIIDLPALQARFEEMGEAIEDCEAATTAAEAVSGEVASVKRAFDRIGGAVLDVDLVDHASIVDSKALLHDGSETTATVTCLTGYIPVVAGYTYTVNQSLSSSTYCNGFYAADKTFISAEYSRGTSPLTLVAPENAAYMRVTGLKASKDALEVCCVLTADGAKLYAMDETLTVAGDVPDSKVVGDEIADLKNALGIDNLENLFFGIEAENIDGSTSAATLERQTTTNGVALASGHTYLYYVRFGVDSQNVVPANTLIYPYLRNRAAYANISITVKAGYRFTGTEAAGDQFAIWGIYTPASDLANVGGWSVMSAMGATSKTVDINVLFVALLDVTSYTDYDDIVSVLSEITEHRRIISSPAQGLLDLDAEIQSIKEHVVSPKTSILTDLTQLVNKRLNTIGWTEDATGFYTNSVGIPVEGGKPYTFEIDGFPNQAYFVVFKTADDITGYNQGTFIQRVAQPTFVMAPATAKYMFFSTTISDWSRIEIYEGFSHFSPASLNIWTCNKTLMTLGDSTSARGIWQSYVGGRLGLGKIVNLAVGGSNVYTFADNVTADNISDVDIVTIMGFFNSTNSAAGNVTDAASNAENASICANYKYLIDKVLTLKPSVKLVLITPHRPQANDVAAKAQAVIDVAKYYGLPYIDLYNEAGFNAYTNSIYLNDTVHSSYGPDGGYAQEAKLISGKLASFYM